MNCLNGQSKKNTYTTTQVTQKFVNIIMYFFSIWKQIRRGLVFEMYTKVW